MTKTYGYRTKRQLPADEGKPKVCTRCDLWFLAGFRERVCQGCQTPSERAKRAAQATTLTTPVKPENPQVRLCPLGCRSTRKDPVLIGIHRRLVIEGLQGCYHDGRTVNKDD